MTTPGDAAKAAGIQQVLDHASPPWSAVFDNELLRLAQSGAAFTSENITGVIGQPPADTHPSAVGARMNAAARRGLITRIGYEKAVRVNQHSAVIAVWRGTAEASRQDPPPERYATLNPEVVRAVSPIRPDEADQQPTGPRCPQCGSTVGDVQPSFDPRFGIGKCPVHGTVEVRL